MKTTLQLCAPLFLSLLLGACATTEAEPEQVAQADRAECVQTIGSHICRKGAGGSPSVTISGDDARRTLDPKPSLNTQGGAGR